MIWVPTLMAVSAVAAAPLTLQQALETADKNQPQIVQARANTRASEQQANQQRAPLLPQVNLNASFERDVGNSAARLGVAGATTSARTGAYNFYRLNAVASQLLYDFGESWNRWRSSQATAAATLENEKATRLSVRLNVRLAYYNATAQRALVQVAQETLANENTHTRQVTGFVTVGTRPEIDLAQQKTTQANAKLQLIQAENDYLTAKAQLNQAMGVEGPIDYDVAEVSSQVQGELPGEGMELEGLLSEALAQRPDYANRRYQIESARRAARAAVGNFFPALSLSAGVNEAGVDITGLNRSAYAQIGLSWALFDGLLNVSTLKAAQAQRESAEAGQDILRQQIRLDLEQSRLAVRAAVASIDAATEAMVNARERLRLAEGRYNAGAGSVIELGDAQVALTNASAQLVSKQYALATARAQLMQRLGRP